MLHHLVGGDKRAVNNRYSDTVLCLSADMLNSSVKSGPRPNLYPKPPGRKAKTLKPSLSNGRVDLVRNRATSKQETHNARDGYE